MPAPKRRPAVFLDRDGTLIHERYYLADPEAVELLPGAAEAVRRLRDAGFAVVLVTNQSGIARGLFSWDDFRAAQDRLEALLAAHGTGLDGVYVCPHHPDFSGPCECRKPKPGLFARAAEDLGLDLRRSFFVGDRWRDVAAAEVLGGTPILLASEYPDELPRDVSVLRDLAEAAGCILGWSRAPARSRGASRR